MNITPTLHEYELTNLTEVVVRAYIKNMGIKIESTYDGVDGNTYYTCAILYDDTLVKVLFDTPNLNRNQATYASVVACCLMARCGHKTRYGFAVSLDDAKIFAECLVTKRPSLTSGWM